MKALLLHGLERNTEALEQIKKVLFKNLTNFTCWHVYGIISKAMNDFETAKKAYMNALKYNPDNENIQRDLCTL